MNYNSFYPILDENVELEAGKDIDETEIASPESVNDGDNAEVVDEEDEAQPQLSPQGNKAKICLSHAI